MALTKEGYVYAWGEATLPGHGIKKQRHDQTHTPHEKMVVDILILTVILITIRIIM